MNYQDKLQQDRRLLVLVALMNAAGYRAASRLLLAFLESMGHTATYDQLLGELAWLQEQGFVALENNGAASIVTVTPRGLEVAQGLAHHPGVRRPAPGEFA